MQLRHVAYLWALSTPQTICLLDQIKFNLIWIQIAKNINGHFAFKKKMQKFN